jgi:hypothetical protein
MMPRSIHELLVPLTLALSGAAAVSCGGAPASPVAPASSAGPAASVALPPPPDLGPVPPPPGLIVSGTLPHLGASFGTVPGWTQLPMPQSEQVTDLLADQPMGAIADLDRPIDFAIAVTGSGTRLHPLVAFSAGVRDLEAAKATLAERYKLVPGENGALLIQGQAATKRRPADSDEDDGDESEEIHPCELAPAYGTSAMRLVCGLDAKSLAGLAPWMTRGATRLSATTDAHFDLRMAPLRPTIAQESRLLGVLLGSSFGGKTGVPGAREMAQAYGEDIADFATDLDTATADVALSDPGAAMTLTMRLTGSASTLGKLLTANADKSGPPPATFWQMPSDSDVAFFGRGFDAATIAHGKQLVFNALSAKLKEDGVKDADRQALVDAAGKLVWSAPMVYASGADVDAARKALAAEKALPESADAAARSEATRASLQALGGWRILEVDEAPATVLDSVKAMATAWGRVAATYKAKGARSVVVRTLPMPKGSTLPKDTQHYAVDVPLAEPMTLATAKPKPKTAPSKPLVLDVFVAPDGARTWIGFGGDPALVSTKLAAAMAATGDGLRARAEIAPMKDAVLGSAGFLTMRGIVELAEGMLSLFIGDPGGSALGSDLLEGITQLPHGGTTPIAFTLTAPAATTGTAVSTMQLPRGAIDDIVMTAIKHGF